jgi:hypothetical protein
MFKRIAYEDWALLIAIISFASVSFIFLVGTIRALRIPKAKRDHLASLPLDLNPTSPLTQPATPSTKQP